MKHFHKDIVRQYVDCHLTALYQSDIVAGTVKRHTLALRWWLPGCSAVNAPSVVPSISANDSGVLLVGDNAGAMLEGGKYSDAFQHERCREK
jgi:hypothetical protein